MTYPVDYTYSYTSNFDDVTAFTNTTSAASYTVDNATITSFCQSAAYKTASRGLNYQHGYEKSIKTMEDAEKNTYRLAHTGNPNAENSFDVFPNPATKLSVIKYQIKQPGNVKISVSDEAGRDVETLLNTTDSKEGSYSLQWDVTKKVPGIYFVQMHNGNYKSVKKVIVMK